jgi:GAF domain-containing protein
LPTFYEGLLYLENELVSGAFTPSRLKVLQILTASAASALENAFLYKRLQEYSNNLSSMVKDRTLELQDKNCALEREVEERIHAEKVIQEALEIAKAATTAKSIFLVRCPVRKH